MQKTNKRFGKEKDTSDWHHSE